MKQLRVLMIAGAFAALATPVFAQTIWGTVQRSNQTSLNVQVANSGEKGLPARATIMVAPDTDFKGELNAANELQMGDMVKINADERNGSWQAKSVEKVDRIPAGQDKQRAGTGMGTQDAQSGQASRGY